MGGEIGPSSARGAGAGWFAIRVLRAGVDGGLAGPGDDAGAAVGAGGGAGPGPRGDRRGVLRRRAEPHGGVEAPPGSRRADRSPCRSRPRLGRDRDRRVRAGVLRQPVRGDGATVRALWRPAVDAGGGRPGRLRVRARRARHDRPRTVIKTGSHPDEHPGADRDGGPGPGAGPVSRRPPAVRVPAGRWRAAPEQSARRLGPPRPPSGARSRDGAFRAVDLRSAARRPFGGTDRAGAERGGRALPVSIRPGTEPPPHRRGLDAGHGHHDLAESAVYGPSGVEPAADRPRPGRPG